MAWFAPRILLPLIALPAWLSFRQPVAPTGTLAGIAFDSLANRPMAGALVEMQDPVRMTVADKNGRFWFDSVPVGTRRLTYSSPELDSIGLYAFARDFDVREGAQSITLATPSFPTLYSRVCPTPDTPPRDSAIIFGTVYDAQSGSRVAGARVSFSWLNVAFEGKTPQLGERVREAVSDAEGDYGICGLPHDVALATVATADSASSSRITQAIGEVRVLRRDMLVSAELATALRIGTADDHPSGDQRSPSRGSGIVRGVVLDESGGALVNALVLLPALDQTVRTDSVGRFVFANIPTGTQELSVRLIGSGAIYQTVDVRANTPVELRLTLPNATTLARVNVRATRRPGMDQLGYLNRRRIGIGQYLEQKELSTRFDMASALKRVSGLVVTQTLGTLDIRTRRWGCGTPQIVLDGVPLAGVGGGSTIPLDGNAPTPTMSMAEQRIDALNPRDVVAVEFYPGTGAVPLEYRTGAEFRCGMLLIWTVFARW